MTDKRPISHYFYLLFLSTVWGCSFLFLKMIAPIVPPLTIAAVRISVGALVIAIYILMKKENFPTHSSIWIKGTIIGIIGTGVPFAFISWSMNYINSGTAAICMSIIPLSVFVMAHFSTHDEKMSWTGLLGIISGICGILVLFYDNLSADNSTLATLALLAMLLAAFGYALANILIRRYVKTDPISTAFVILTTSSLVIWPITFIFESPLDVNYGSVEILSLLYLGILPTGIATMVLVTFTQKAGSTFVSYNTYLIPIVGVLAGYIVLDEALKQTTILSILFIAVGIYISQRPKKTSLSS